MIDSVFDANVLASGFAFAGGAPDQLIRLWQAKAFRLVVSQHIIDEVQRTLAKPHFAVRFSPVQVQEAVSLLQATAKMTPITSKVAGVAPHPEDDQVLAAAVSGGVDYLATGDRQLQKLGAYGGVTILIPRAFLLLLTQS